jgi:preprotein translocase subunit SecE
MQQSTLDRWVYGSFLAGSALLGYVMWAAATYLTGFYDLETSIARIDLVLQGFGIGVAAVSMLVLSFNESAFGYMEEVVSEVSKMTWPSPKDTHGATFVVMLMVLVIGLILGFFDFVFSGFMEWILKLAQ